LDRAAQEQQKRPEPEYGRRERRGSAASTREESGTYYDRDECGAASDQVEDQTCRWPTQPGTATPVWDEDRSGREAR